MNVGLLDAVAHVFSSRLCLGKMKTGKKAGNGDINIAEIAQTLMKAEKRGENVEPWACHLFTYAHHESWPGPSLSLRELLSCCTTRAVQTPELLSFLHV